MISSANTAAFPSWKRRCRTAPFVGRRGVLNEPSVPPQRPPLAGQLTEPRRHWRRTHGESVPGPLLHALARSASQSRAANSRSCTGYRREGRVPSSVHRNQRKLMLAVFCLSECSSGTRHAKTLLGLTSASPPESCPRATALVRHTAARRLTTSTHSIRVAS